MLLISTCHHKKDLQIANIYPYLCVCVCVFDSTKNVAARYPVNLYLKFPIAQNIVKMPSCEMIKSAKCSGLRGGTRTTVF